MALIRLGPSDSDYYEMYVEATRLLERCLEDLEEIWSNYGQGYGVANFHLNGELEPLDNFLTTMDGDLPKTIRNYLNLPLTDTEDH